MRKIQPTIILNGDQGLPMLTNITDQKVAKVYIPYENPRSRKNIRIQTCRSRPSSKMESLKKAASDSEDFGLRKRFPWSFRFRGELESRVITENLRTEEENYLSTLLGNQISDIQNCFVGRIENPFLWSRYALSYEEMRADPTSSNVTEHVVIHSTSFSAAIEIAENNFDWRLVRRHRFGHGVSFARDVDYAAKQATQKGTYVVAGILVANSRIGKDGTVIPPGLFDTTTNAAKSVYVKYNDNDYYPYYIVD